VSLARPFADPQAVAGLVDEIRTISRRLARQVTVMEVCGTHTHAVAAAGLRRMLPENVRLVSGPGCPVCVTPVGYLDRALALAALPDTTVCTFGDLMRVPSSTVSLEQARAAGASVEIVYSPRDALDKARFNPNRRIVFLAVGFETTVPTIAATVVEAEADDIPNFLILPGNKVMPPPMRALADDPDLAIDGFLLPGHVSVIVGADAFRFLTDDHHAPGVVVGFEPTDVLRGVITIMRQTETGDIKVENLYGRVVTAEGNRVALDIVDRLFEPAATVWRGFGPIEGSGLTLRESWRHRDAETITVEIPDPAEPVGCRCGDVLRGAIDPPECPLFDAGCDPSTPVGACMVSSEGTCAAWHRHERWSDGGVA